MRSKYIEINIKIPKKCLNISKSSVNFVSQTIKKLQTTEYASKLFERIEVKQQQLISES